MGNCGGQGSVGAATPAMRMQPEVMAPVSSATPLQNGDKFDAIVIGGGIAGVASAVELAKTGRRVAILQANSYLGGRLKSPNINLQGGGNLAFDQGASWIHGSCGENPITKLSKGVQGLAMKQTDDDSIEVYDQDGNEAQKPTQQAFEIYEKLMEKVQKYQPNYSMWQAFQQQEKGIVNNKYFMYNVANDIQFQTSGSINKLAANGADDDQYQGKQMLILSGYQRFPQALISSAKVQLYLNQKIKKVIWNQQINQVICANGLSVYARDVIFAVPIGVLKSNSIQFYPNLPQQKVQAISSIGFGNVCKILLDFPDGDFLDSKNHYIGVVSNDVRKRGLGTYFLNLKAIAGIPALMTFGLGENADQAQRMNQNQLRALLAKRINVFAKQQIGPNDFRMYKTTWRSNPNFQGTYAYAATTTRPEHWQNMAKPVFDNHWYFCGQHTTSKYRGTVHGAYLSGVYAANWIKDQSTYDDWAYPDFADESDKSKKSKSDRSDSRKKKKRERSESR